MHESENELSKSTNASKKENYMLQENDQIYIAMSHPEANKLAAALLDKDDKSALVTVEEIQDMLLYEDTHRLVRNKPAGIVTHPGDKHSTDLSLHDYLLRYLEATEQLQDSPTFSPSFCFRLDKDTSGVLIAAKTYEGLQELNELIRDRKVEKTYLCALVGHLAKPLTNDKSLFV
ncbi:MAG: hypothetical protein H6765_02060 [Candidatus Peribacteria bacterium]|nr:MAG: hypothetical protein H6765_02060 [Candidatus Peribacteria bacterium]